MSSYLLETHGLRKRFGDKLAVADLSLALRPGEVFGFLGPNGAGKTTSLKMILGLLEPSGGHGLLLGKPLGDQGARAKVGFLPEHFRFPDWLTGRELLHFHGRLYGLGGSLLRERSEALLARVDLLDAAHRPLKGYSKGMLQRAGLAAALLNEPQLVFLDEPTSGLDPLGRLLVRDLIRDLRAQGTSVFLNSHLLGEVEATCDRVVFVKQGRVVHEHVLGAHEAHRDVRIRAHGMSDALCVTLASLGEGFVRDGDRASLRVDGDSRLPQIAAAIVNSGAALFELDAAPASLEQLFLAVMGTEQRPG